jgi:hypothetical protein
MLLTDVSDLRPTIIPKSDQLNADQLVAGPMDIVVTDVRIGSEDQPVIVHYEDDGGRPFKPCKTMRRVLIVGWGQDGRDWIGKSMRLYHDGQVRFGGAEVGGIRISHMSDIERAIEVRLSATKGKKALHRIERMERPDSVLQDISDAPTVEALKDNFGAAWRSEKNKALRPKLKDAYDKRMAELQKPAGDAKTLQQWKDAIDNAADRETAAALLDAAASLLLPDELKDLQQSFDMAWTT